MSYSQAFKDWLKDLRYADSRIVLIEINHGNVIYGLSDYPFSSDALIYDDLVVEPIEMQEGFDAPSGVGDITFADNQRNFWLTDDFSGDQCNLYLGDSAWSRSEFSRVLSATIESIECIEDDVYRINFDNTDYRLDKEIEQDYIDDQLIPLVFGNPFNCSPILSDYGTQEYQFNNSAIDAITVRDIGLTPASVTNDFSNGKIKLGSMPEGQVTGDIVEQHDTLIKIIDYLLVLSGVAVDTTPLLNIKDQDNYKIGWYGRDSITYRDLITEIITPLGLTLRRNNFGIHELISIEKSTPIFTLDVDDIFTISQSSIEPKKEKIELGYARNFTVQSEGTLALPSANGLTEEDKARYELEYKILSGETGVVSLGKDTTLRIDTLLTNESQAQDELNRLLLEYKNIRRRWTLEVAATGLIMQIGDTITIDDSMLSDDVVIIAIEKNLSSQQVALEVLQ